MSFWTKLFWPKYRVREVPGGKYVAETKQRFYQSWVLLLRVDALFYNWYDTSLEAENRIEEEHKRFLELKRKKLIKEYTPKCDSPLEKAMK